jgi:acetoacetate decarboxylase
MATIRYGARPPDQQRSREIEATRSEIWSQALTVIYQTDPDLIAAVLPPPLEPIDDTVRIRIATVTMPVGPPFGAGWFGVRCRHEGTDGEYPLFMPMTTEQATVGGRETFGEPKKIAEVRLDRAGATVHAAVTRMGFPVIEITGGVTETLAPPPEKNKTDFYFKFLPSPDGKGFDADPALVYCYRVEKARSAEHVDAQIVLGESPLDPVADLPVRRIIDATWSEIATIQTGEIHSRVPSDWVLPYVHQRYDDLSVLGKAAKD